MQGVRDDRVAAEFELWIRSLVKADAGDHFPRLRDGKYRVERFVFGQLLRDLGQRALELATRARIDVIGTLGAARARQCASHPIVTRETNQLRCRFSRRVLEVP